MAAKRASKKAPYSRRLPKAPSPRNLLLLFTLLPLVAGVLLVIAWAGDIIIWGSDQFQISLAFLLILISFAASNAVQKHWILAAGWTLLSVADVILLTWIDLNRQTFAFILAGIGGLLLAFEFFRRIRQQVISSQK